MVLDVFQGGEVVAQAQVDPIDHLWASQYRWHLAGKYVARSERRGPDDKPYRMFLHREVTGVKHGYPGWLIDHINGNPLDNQRANLRVVTAAENCQNRKSYEGSTSRYSGVSWYPSKGQWRVAIMFHGKRTLVGYFDDEDEAGRAAAEFRKSHQPREGTAARPRLIHSEGSNPRSPSLMERSH